MRLRSVARSIVFASLPARAKALLPFLAYSSSPSKSIARARRKISVRTEENFLTYGNLFSYVRKFCPLRTSIFRLPHGAKFSCAQKKISFRKKIYFLAEEKILSCGRKFWRLPKKNSPPFELNFCAVRKERNFRAHENKFPHMRKYFFVYTEINFLICGNFIPCKPAGNAGCVGRVRSGREKPWVDTSSPSFRWGKEGLLGWGGKAEWPSRRTLVQSLSERLELVADLPKLIQRVAA